MKKIIIQVKKVRAGNKYTVIVGCTDNGVGIPLETVADFWDLGVHGEGQFHDSTGRNEYHLGAKDALFYGSLQLISKDTNGRIYVSYSGDGNTTKKLGDDGLKFTGTPGGPIYASDDPDKHYYRPENHFRELFGSDTGSEVITKVYPDEYAACNLSQYSFYDYVNELENDFRIRHVLEDKSTTLTFKYFEEGSDNPKQKTLSYNPPTKFIEVETVKIFLDKLPFPEKYKSNEELCPDTGEEYIPFKIRKFIDTSNTVNMPPDDKHFQDKFRRRSGFLVKSTSPDILDNTFFSSTKNANGNNKNLDHQLNQVHAQNYFGEIHCSFLKDKSLKNLFRDNGEEPLQHNSRLSLNVRNPIIKALYRICKQHVEKHIEVDKNRESNSADNSYLAGSKLSSTINKLMDDNDLDGDFQGENLITGFIPPGMTMAVGESKTFNFRMKKSSKVKNKPEINNNEIVQFLEKSDENLSFIQDERFSDYSRTTIKIEAKNEGEADVTISLENESGEFEEEKLSIVVIGKKILHEIETLQFSRNRHTGKVGEIKRLNLQAPNTIFKDSGVEGYTLPDIKSDEGIIEVLHISELNISSTSGHYYWFVDINIKTDFIGPKQISASIGLSDAFCTIQITPVGKQWKFKILDKNDVSGLENNHITQSFLAHTFRVESIYDDTGEFNTIYVDISHKNFGGKAEFHEGRWINCIVGTKMYEQLWEAISGVIFNQLLDVYLQRQNETSGKESSDLELTQGSLPLYGDDSYFTYSRNYRNRLIPILNEWVKNQINKNPANYSEREKYAESYELSQEEEN
ncbi:hypothetical protein M1N55_06525 [Dehalococcoidia bacterium]|nr:hypothetical protein [Dehalococcoidia bacterium]